MIEQPAALAAAIVSAATEHFNSKPDGRRGNPLEQLGALPAFAGAARC